MEREKTVRPRWSSLGGKLATGFDATHRRPAKQQGQPLATLITTPVKALLKYPG
jgi:hypothetical protein